MNTIHPASLMRRDDDVVRLRDVILPAWLQRLYAAAVWLAPFLPSTSRRIREHLARVPLTTAPPLFPRL